MARKVFVSYASAERALAEAIVDAAEGAGIDCWIAPRDIVAGSDWAESIPSAIADARALLLVLSASSIASKEVVREVHLANTRATPILPYRVDAAEPTGALQYLISGVHRIDAERGTRDFGRLVEHLRKLLEGAPLESPAMTTAVPRPGLPAPPSSFVGRANETSEIGELVATSRLTTVAGPGGIGKTRLALYVASVQARDGSVAFVELAPLSSGAPAPAAIAKAAGVTLPGEGDELESLARLLRDRRLLLVLDNCEHLIDDVARLVTVLLRECSQVSVLTTSRSALGIDGESVYRVPAMAEREAVELFVARARAVNQNFAMTGNEREIVAEICRRLDGIALAIELAAARTNILSVGAIRDRLGERFALLSSGARGSRQQQRTLHAVFDWSYDLLDDAERRFFRRCTAFADPFTLEAIACVHGEGIREYDAFDLLDSLVNKSLVVADTSVEPARFRMLESTYAYAREKLAPEEAAEMRARHFAYFLERFLRAGDAYEITASGKVLEDLALEIDDARDALAYAQEQGNVAGAADLFVATPLWIGLGLLAEGIERARRYIALLGDGDPVRRALLWTAVAWATSHSGNWTASSEAAEAAERLARIGGDSAALADALTRLAWSRYATRRFEEAQAALDEAQVCHEETTRRRLQVLDTRALLAFARADHDQAATFLERSRDLCRTAGNDRGAATAAANLAEVEHARDRTLSAIDVLRRAIPDAERVTDGGALASTLWHNLAGYLAASSDSSGARHAALRALQLRSPSAPLGAATAVTLEHLALAIAIDGDLVTAARLEGYAERAFRDAGFQREYTERTTYERLLHLLSALGADLAPALRDGELLSEQEAVSVGLSACEPPMEASQVRDLKA